MRSSHPRYEELTVLYAEELQTMYGKDTSTGPKNIASELIDVKLILVGNNGEQFINFLLNSYRCTNQFREMSTSLRAFNGRKMGGGGWKGGSSGGRYSRPDSLPIRFTKTIKIDPENKTPLEDMPFSSKTKAILVEKGFVTMTPIQSQSYDLVFSGADVVEKAIKNGVHILVATPGRALDHISRGTVDLSRVQHIVLDEGDTMLEMGFQKDVESIIANVKQPGEASRKAAMTLLDNDDFEYGSSDKNSKSWKPNSSSRNNGIFEDLDDEGDEGFSDYDDRDNYLDDDSIDRQVEDDFDDFKSFAAKAKEKLAIGAETERAVQMLLFSATMPGWICKLTDKHMRSPVFLDAVQEGETRLSASIKHYCLRLPQGGSKLSVVSSFAENLILTKGGGGQTIVFTNTKEEADNLFGSECFGSMRTQVLHGDISQNTRQATIKQFKEGLIEVLIATDVAARGLDIAGVDLVMHTGPPNDHDTYVHRSGRTGRAGRNGTSICLFTGNDEGKLRMFENSLNFKFERIGPPTLKDISEACAAVATRKVHSIDSTVAKLMLPHAQQLIHDFVQRDHSLNEDDDSDITTEEKYQVLVARCLGALSNGLSMLSRSLLTGEEGWQTLQVEAVFKNGTSPDNVRDWQRLLASVLKRSMDIDNVEFGKVNMGRTGDTRIPCAVLDLQEETAHQVLEALEKIKLPTGLSIKECSVLPYITEYSTRSSSYGERRFSSGSRPPSYGDKSWGRGSRSVEGSSFRGSSPNSASSYSRSRSVTGERKTYTPGGRVYNSN
ncbi:unnamed protein product [Sphagnum jensenii]|uniref:RNA helicase n=1 Tax=Sphagnum jensenii TaxID=128206 RepID=A0ABP0VEB5_9BRYO